jgi:hypothetical protein
MTHIRYDKIKDNKERKGGRGKGKKRKKRERKGKKTRQNIFLIRLKRVASG